MEMGLAIAAFAAAIGVGLILLQAGLSKLRHRHLLPGVVANYRLLPSALVAPAATILPLAEIAIGATLIAGFTTVPVVLAMLLLALFAGAMAINIARGRDHIDCGCGRSDLRHPIGWPLVARNLLLIALVALRLGPALPFSALDIGTAAVGGLALFLAYHLLGHILALIAAPAAAYRR
ncbi:MauE/DoxX family redox-associated membrane protein [Sphingobium sp. CCH11-B1]|jgi:hypothetical protein|uniref:MauE/DoxX family redox-associated membrane protein n=1 Tax=Sphingobium sp. CCH11-B1 TaxID=1768781 RepID=UPI000833304E|nr:MauE/DoxX family redox-associated membrane protein [Sphingobium sp. CCH11-B1]MEA3389972.1 MauE/DoxX family redox-associated membrane protein [Pseudomonadota bacterium]